MRIGAHVITDWSLTQPVIALSSGESEFYASARGIRMLLFVRNLAAECGMTFGKLQLEVGLECGTRNGVQTVRGLEGQAHRYAVLVLPRARAR